MRKARIRNWVPVLLALTWPAWTVGATHTRADPPSEIAFYVR